MNEDEKADALMDNERNLALYSFLGVVLAHLGFNFPMHELWLVPLIFTEIAAILLMMYGVFRYLERRKMILEGKVEINEKKW